jgi:hypothetical protein
MRRYNKERRLIVRRPLPLVLLLLATTAGCGQVAENDSSPSNPTTIVADTDAETSNAASETTVAGDIPAELPAARVRPSRESGPGIDPQSAPGVAFDYSYSFRLEAERIAEMQQEHQRLCERYGPRCRITGMDYRAQNGDDVEAMLSFLVDPAIAGQFGRESVRAVEAADGELANSDISGTEIGTALKTNTRNLAELQAELERIEARLASGNLRRGERSQLTYERQTLRDQIAGLRDTTEHQERQLATTPILFRYGSGNLAPGPARMPTVSEAAENAADTFLGGVNMLLVIFITLSPWLLAGLGIWWLIRLLRRRAVGAETGA